MRSTRPPQQPTPQRPTPQRPTDETQLGRLLINAGAITGDQLDAARREQNRFGHPLGRTLLEMKLVDERVMVDAIASQTQIPGVDLQHQVLDEQALELLTAEFCVANSCLPFHFTSHGRFLDVAMADPTNERLFDEIRIRTKCNVRPHIAGPNAINQAVRQVYLGEPARFTAEPGKFHRPQTPTESTRPVSSRNNTVAGDQRTGPAHRRVLTTNAAGKGNSADKSLDKNGAAATHTPPASSADAGDKNADSQTAIEMLRAELRELKEKVERDERLIRELMKVFVDKELCTQQELLTRFNVQ